MTIDSLPNNVLESFTVEGKWWLPNERKEKDAIFGTLTFQPNQFIEVNFFEPLEIPQKNQNIAGQNKHLPLLYGSLATGDYVALVNPLYVGVEKIHFKSALSLQSRCISNGPLIVFQNLEPFVAKCWTKAWVEITNLENWLFKSPLEIEMNPSPKLEVKLTTNQISEHLKNIDCQRLSLSIGANWKGPTVGNISVSYYGTNDFFIEYNEPQTHNDIQLDASQLCKLMSFMIGSPQCVKNIKCAFIQEVDTESTQFEANLFPIGQNPELVQNLKWSKILLPSLELENGGSAIIKTFMTDYSKFETPIGLFQAVAKQPKIYSEFQFLAYAQSIESLHSSLFKQQKYVNKSEHRKLLKEIQKNYPSDMDKEYRDSLDGAIGQANRYSLRSKLTELIKHIDHSIIELSGVVLVDYILRCVDWRNKIAHGDFDPSKEERELFNDDRYLLKILLEGILLHLLGISKKSVVIKLIERDSYLLNQIAGRHELRRAGTARDHN